MIPLNASERIYQKFLDGELAVNSLQEICKILSIPYREKDKLLPILDALIQNGMLFINQDGKYGTSEQLGLIVGKIEGNERGFGFFVPEDKSQFDKDFFVPRKNLHGALHGDLVLCEIVNTRYYENERDEVSVMRVLQRGYSQIVGTFRRDKKAGYLFPDEKKFSTHIFIPLSDCANIPNGVKAVAKITSYPYARAPGGQIIEVLGEEEDFFAEELSIIRSYDLREEFPVAVEKDAEKQQRKGISEKDYAMRKDFRDTLIVTIDGEDTRDIDDAISLEKIDGHYHLGVHIADVTHYVTDKSLLDKEAYERGTSVYFPDCVLPMLPRALSNGICSLNPNEERLALSCLITMDEKGNIVDSEICESIIRSSYKMTYTEVSAILENKPTRYNEKVQNLVFLFAELTRILQDKRAKKGSVTLDIKEAKILFNKDTNEITIPDYTRPFSYQIIEAFMVLANETVAEYMQAIDAPFIYRVHEKPTEEKAQTFRAFAQSLGLTARFNADTVRPFDYQRLLNSAKDLPAFPVLNRVMLRSMQKARYAEENLGHFGLASECYCHFTSPIRRYPDLCIHRIIKQVLHGGYDDAHRRFDSEVAQIAKHTSERERRANDAERDVDDLYKTMYMSDKIGEEYDAVISGVASFGIFAELPNTIEGFIPVESLYGEYQFIEHLLCLKGRKESYSIGERIRVEVSDVDFYRRRTQFTLLNKINEIRKP